MQTPAQDGRLTLREVSAAFDEWRKTKVGRQSIPEELWKRTRRLKSGYRPTQIYTSLGINSQQYHANVMTLSQPSPPPTGGGGAKNKSPQFIELCAESLKKPITQELDLEQHANQATIEFAREDGTHLTLRKLTERQFKETLRLFLER